MFKRAIHITLLLLGFSLAGMSICVAQVSTEQLAEVERQAQARQMEHKKLQAQATQLSLDLANMNKKLISAARQLQADEEKTTKMEAKLQLLEGKLTVAEAEFNKENAKLAQSLASLQNLALHPTEALLVQPLSPVDIIRSAILLRESVPHLNKKADKIKQDLEQISTQKKQVETQLKKLAAQKKSLLKQQQDIKKLAAKKSAVRKKIAGESQKTKQEAEKLASQATDLREFMEKLEHEQEIRRRKQKALKQEARKRELAAQRRLEEEQRRRLIEGRGQGLYSEDGEPYQDEGVAEMDDAKLIKPKLEHLSKGSANFAKARGRLTRPARGPVVTSYGQELSKGVTSKGIVIKTREDAQVIAPYDGSVIFSGPFKGYGNLIIIDHEQGYVSLLAGMNSVDAEIGQMVLAGEPVGVMPTTDAAKLYIEIRKDRRPINPMSWFSE